MMIQIPFNDNDQTDWLPTEPDPPPTWRSWLRDLGGWACRLLELGAWLGSALALASWLGSFWWSLLTLPVLGLGGLWLMLCLIGQWRGR